jgi:hypothetical protein
MGLSRRKAGEEGQKAVVGYGNHRRPREDVRPSMTAKQLGAFGNQRLPVAALPCPSDDRLAPDLVLSQLLTE